MKILILMLGLSLTGSFIMAQDNKEPEFEMKQYFFVFLNSAPNAPELDSAKMSEVMKGHLGNITKMWEEGKCVLAGPFMDKGEMRGILILNTATREEAEELCSKDPAVTNGQLVMVIKPWYGPANLKVEANSNNK